MAIPRIGRLSFLPPPITTSQASSANFTNVPRAPIFVTPQAKCAVFTGVVPNLLVSTLAVVAAQPPFGAGNSLTPTARIVPSRIQDFIAPNILPLGIPPARPPFVSRELQSAPRAGRLNNFDPPPNLLTSTFTVRPPFSQSDWPRTLRIPDGSGQVTEYVLLLPPTFPFPQGDVSAPRSRFVQSTLEAPNLLASTLAGAPPPPFAQTYWPAPLRALPAIPTIDPPQLLLSTLIPAVIAFPFNQFDWPNAPVPVQALDRHFTWANSQLPNAIPPLVPPVVAPQDVGHSIELSQHRSARELEHALFRNLEPFANPELARLTEVRVTPTLVADETSAPGKLTVRYDVEIASILWMLS